MLITKERDPSDVEAPMEGHSALIVNTSGAVTVKRSNGDVVTSSGAKSWSALITATGDLQTGVLNRYDGNVAMTLSFPESPVLGDEIEVANTGGAGASEDVIFDGNGQNIVNASVVSSADMTVSNPGFYAHWKWDGSVWRLLNLRFGEVG
jgi:hypothetical protein